jgi:hypothetical protein
VSPDPAFPVAGMCGSLGEAEAEQARNRPQIVVERRSLLRGSPIYPRPVHRLYAALSGLVGVVWVVSAALRDNVSADVGMDVRIYPGMGEPLGVLPLALEALHRRVLAVELAPRFQSRWDQPETGPEQGK